MKYLASDLNLPLAIEGSMYLCKDEIKLYKYQILVGENHEWMHLKKW